MARAGVGCAFPPEPPRWRESLAAAVDFGTVLFFAVCVAVMPLLALSGRGDDRRAVLALSASAPAKAGAKGPTYADALRAVESGRRVTVFAGVPATKAGPDVFAVPAVPGHPAGEYECWREGGRAVMRRAEPPARVDWLVLTPTPAVCRT